MSANLKEIGTFTKVHGLKGLLVFKAHQASDAWTALKLLYINDRRFGFRPFRIAEIKADFSKKDGQSFFVQLEGIDNRRDASLLHHAAVHTESDFVDHFVEDDESAFWEGFLVFLADGSRYGSVISEQFNGDHDLLLIQNQQDQTFWLPAVEAYVLEVDEEERKLVINDPSELLAINQMDEYDED